MVEIDFAAEMKLVPIVRRFIAQFYGALIQDEDLVSRLALTTHELMENAIKYSARTPAKLTVEMRRRGSQVEFSVRVANAVCSEHAELVTRILGALDSSPDPMSFYLARMAETARTAEGSGLGLARIRVEADMKLSHKIEGDWMEIVARSSKQVAVQ